MLTSHDMKQIAELAVEKDGLDWKHSYKKIAERFGVTRSYISSIAKWHGVGPRQPGMRRGEAAVPLEFKPLYATLKRKVGTTEASRIIKEHLAVKAAEKVALNRFG